MTSKMRELINELAEAVIDTFEISIPISNIEEAVKKLGGRIELDTSLSIFSDGYIKKDGENGFVIRISPHQTNERKLFTIAHELGHLFLHMGFKTDSDEWKKQNENVFFRNRTSEEEYQANEFAAAFLMPEKKYRKQLEKYTEGFTVYTSKIADYFGVSVAAASNRGKWLGLLEW